MQEYGPEQLGAVVQRGQAAGAPPPPFAPIPPPGTKIDPSAVSRSIPVRAPQSRIPEASAISHPIRMVPMLPQRPLAGSVPNRMEGRSSRLLAEEAARVRHRRHACVEAVERASAAVGEDGADAAVAPEEVASVKKRGAGGLRLTGKDVRDRRGVAVERRVVAAVVLERNGHGDVDAAGGRPAARIGGEG